jgi:uncharacterized protein YbjT (DUF2867 family)
MRASQRPVRPHPSVARPIAVVGATGQQGGAVARALMARSVPVRALVRDAESEKARALAGGGAELAVADLEDQGSLEAAFTDVAGVFAMASPTPDGGAAGEEAHGRAIADAASATGVAHVVYSSVDGADRDTGIPHFESKRRIEEYLEELGVPSTFVRPVFFMDNFARFMVPTVEDGAVVVRMPMPADVPLQMIASADVAAIAVIALLQPDRIAGGAVEIGGDELSGEQIAAAYGQRRGLAGRYQALPTDVLDEDSQAMFEWFAHPPAYQADFKATRQLHPQVMTFTDWLRTSAD